MTAYLNCPRCALSIERRPDEPPTEAICPRCEGQVGIAVPMYVTDRRRPPTPTEERRTPQTA